MKNIETMVIDHLNSAGIKTYGVAPQKHVYPFATVELLGRSNLVNHFVERRSVSVTTWAASFVGAAELMQKVEESMETFDDTNISEVEEDSLIRFPSTDGIPRYQAAYDFIVNK